jgi:hypothetical protein
MKASYDFRRASWAIGNCRSPKAFIYRMAIVRWL